MILPLSLLLAGAVAAAPVLKLSPTVVSAPALRAGPALAATLGAAVPIHSAAILAAPAIAAPASIMPILSAQAPALAAPGDIIPGPGREPADMAGAFDGARPKDAVRDDYDGFLQKLGFRDFGGETLRTLEKGKLLKGQREVLEYNKEAFAAADAARELAAEVMAGLARQRYGKKAMENGTELAARLLELQALDPVTSLPPAVAKQGSGEIAEWLSVDTGKKLGLQLQAVVSDVMLAIYGEKGLDRAFGTPQFDAHVTRIKGLVEAVLFSAYTDAQLGQTRYAGRALAASLVRYSRLNARPEVEKALESKLRERDLRLENFVGDTLHVTSLKGKTVKLALETGDFLGERSTGREAAEITFAVRPPYSRWWRAWRDGMAASLLTLWANPEHEPQFKKGQPVRNAWKAAVRGLQRWLAERPILQRGYSHVGLVKVDRADGVSMAWALDNYPNDGEGGIRKIGIVEQYAQKGPYVRLGYARLDPYKVWDAFQKQAQKGWQKTVFTSGGFEWPSQISKEDFERLRRLPREKAPELLAEINARSAEVFERMITVFGVAFAYGFENGAWKIYCSATDLVAFLMGAQFDLQSKPDMWNPVVRVMKALGLGAKDQKMDERIVWPASFFVDEKVAEHRRVTLPKFLETGAGRLDNPYTIPGYVELDPELTRRLTASVRLTEGRWDPDSALIQHALERQLQASGKRQDKSGFRSGAARRAGYSAGLAEFFAD